MAPPENDGLVATDGSPLKPIPDVNTASDDPLLGVNFSCGADAKGRASNPAG